MVKWTERQLQYAREIESGVVGDPRYGAKIRIVPIFRGTRDVGYANEIDWDVRLMKRGSYGPLPVELTTLKSVGCTEEEAQALLAQVDYSVKFLKEAYPGLKVEIGERVKALEPELREALPGESE